jgi:hypothetical protein
MPWTSWLSDNIVDLAARTAVPRRPSAWLKFSAARGNLRDPLAQPRESVEEIEEYFMGSYVAGDESRVGHVPQWHRREHGRPPGAARNAATV